MSNSLVSSDVMTIEQKITSRERLHELIPTLAAQGKRVAYTSGVFDLLHPGHVDYLEQAKALCDILVVGINSDASVKSNKGELRPICGEQDRAQIVAALASVDYVFLFDEKNNNTNIELLKPQLYIKAGDYAKSSLSSAPLVEKYGGEVKLIQLKTSHSSSKIINKISAQALQGLIVPEELPASDPKPTVFLDRDGTINEEVYYLHEPSKLKLLPGAMEALKKLKQAGFNLVMVTNQPGIGLGYFTKEDFYQVTRALFGMLAKEQIKFSKIYFCPHSESEMCECRKPNDGMLKRARSELSVDWKRSFVVGDMTSDVQMGLAAGVRAILVETGSAGSDGKCKVTPTARVADLLEAADYIIANA